VVILIGGVVACADAATAPTGAPTPAPSFPGIVSDPVSLGFRVAGARGVPALADGAASRASELRPTRHGVRTEHFRKGNP